MSHPALIWPTVQPVTIPPGFLISGIGQVFRVDHDETTRAAAELWANKRGAPSLPWSWLHEEIYEWIALAEAARAANEKFTMVELGAGFGRWIVAGSLLARQFHPNIELKLIGVEADPIHFRWMREHFIDNGLDPDCHILVEAAIDVSSGIAQFCRSENAGMDYGQHIAQESDDTSRLPPTPVPAIGFSDLLRQHDYIDLIDVDIQGHERIIIPAGMEAMSKRVKRAYISIHEPKEIGEEVADSFSSRGWIKQASF